MDLPEVVTTAELAEAVGVHRTTVTRHCRDGTIRNAVKAGHDWIIPRASAEAYASDYEPYQALRRKETDQ